MKAVILAGGNGTRLKPLTNHLQKTMVEINDKPLLWYHINHLKSHRINSIWLLLSKFSESVIDYFGDGSKYGVNVNYSTETRPLGTAGSLNNPDSNIKKELRNEEFIVIYGDNLTNIDYTSLLKFHHLKKSFLTIGLYKSKEPWTGGVIEIYNNGRIKSLVEKPPKEEVKTNTISAGVMVCKPEVLDYIPTGFSDFGFNILPKLIDLNKPMFALDTKSYVQDCGTQDRLIKARNDYSLGDIKFNF